MPQHTIRPKRYLVEMTGPELAPVTFECRVIAADILKAEEAAPTYGIKGERSPIALTLLWVWAAARREGHVTLGWPEFRAQLVDWVDLARLPDGVEEAAVDPTQPAGHTPSPSPSPSVSEGSTSTDGSVPSSTTLP